MDQSMYLIVIFNYYSTEEEMKGSVESNGYTVSVRRYFHMFIISHALLKLLNYRITWMWHRSFYSPCRNKTAEEIKNNPYKSPFVVTLASQMSGDKSVIPDQQTLHFPQLRRALRCSAACQTFRTLPSRCHKLWREQHKSPVTLFRDGAPPFHLLLRGSGTRFCQTCPN